MKQIIRTALACAVLSVALPCTAQAAGNGLTVPEYLPADPVAYTGAATASASSYIATKTKTYTYMEDSAKWVLDAAKYSWYRGNRLTRTTSRTYNVFSGKIMTDDTTKYSYSKTKKVITTLTGDGEVSHKTVYRLKNGKILSCKDYDSSGELFQDARYEYKDGLLISIKTEYPGYCTREYETYSYNKKKQLISHEHYNSSDGITTTDSYTYFANGNTRKWSYTTSNGYKGTTWYNRNGSCSKIKSSGPDGSQSSAYRYDSKGRLICLKETFPDRSTHTISYSGYNRHNDYTVQTETYRSVDGTASVSSYKYQCRYNAKGITSRITQTKGPNDSKWSYLAKETFGGYIKLHK